MSADRFEDVEGSINVDVEPHQSLLRYEGVGFRAVAAIKPWIQPETLGYELEELGKEALHVLEHARRNAAEPLEEERERLVTDGGRTVPESRSEEYLEMFLGSEEYLQENLLRELEAAGLFSPYY